MSEIDHRGLAEHLAESASELWEDNPDAAMFEARLAQVHATLAAGTPVADQHVSEALANARSDYNRALKEYGELREQVRAFVVGALLNADDGVVIVNVEHLHALRAVAS